MFPNRIRRVEETIKGEIALILQNDLKDPRLSWTTVQHVVVTRDLRHARVYVSVLEHRKDHTDEIVDVLNGAAGFVRRLLGERIRIKFLPELRFYKDDTPSAAQHLEQLFRQEHLRSAEDTTSGTLDPAAGTEKSK